MSNIQVGTTYPPCVYYLLPNKTQRTYTRMIRLLKDVCPNSAPNRILVDFESAAINAFEV